MAGLPARCTRCGFEFESRAINIEGVVKGLRLSNITETCPNCGGTARLVEGTFNVRGGVIEALQATAADRGLLLRFAALARQVDAGAVTAEEAATEMARESPELQRLLDRVPPKVRRIFIWVLLQALIIAAAQFVSDELSDSATPADVARIEAAYDARTGHEVRHEVEVAVEQALVRYYGQQSGSRSPHPETRKREKVGRNDPCPCGSGIKYKRCCGR
jgi:hypothetical protein